MEREILTLQETADYDDLVAGAILGADGRKKVLRLGTARPLARAVCHPTPTHL